MLLSEEQPEKCLLSQNALILLDNTLWKGLVLREVRKYSFTNTFPHLFIIYLGKRT